MVAFNPNVPAANDPLYIGYSKPIEQPKADTTLGTAIAGVGNLIEAGAQGADFLVKDVIKTRAEEGIDSIRDSYTQSLDTAKAAVTGQPTDNPAGPLLLTQNTDVPYQVNNGVNAAKTLSDALASGKISPTYYYGRLNALAKNLRAQFPGYRDYIDQQISSMVGGNPANEYIAHITADINSQLTSAKSDQEKKLNFLRETGKFDGGANYNAVLNGTKTIDQAISDIMKIQGEEHSYTAQSSRLAAEDAQRKADLNEIHETITNRANTLVTRGINIALTSAGLNGQRIDDLLTRAQNGTIALQPQEQEQLLTSLNLLERKLQGGVKKDLLDSGLYAKDPTYSQNAITDALSYVRKLKDDIVNKDYGSLFSNARMNTAMNEQTKYNLYTSSMGTYLQTQKAFHDTGGDEAVKRYWQYATTKDKQGNSIDQYMRKWASEQTFNFAVQPDLRTNPNALKTLLGTTEELKKSSLTPPAKAAALDRVIGSVPAVVLSPGVSDTAKRNVVEAAYSSKNSGLFNNIQKDQVTDNNRQIPGRMSAFTQLFSKEMTAEVKKLGPEAWQTYVDRAKTAFGSEILNSEINDLNTIAANPSVKLTWDTVNHRWDVSFSNTAALRGQPAGMDLNLPGYVQQKIRTTINRLNTGLSSLKEIYKADGNDETMVDGYLLSLMTGMGFDPLKAPQTFTEQMLRSIVTARAAEAFKNQGAKPTGTRGNRE